MHRFIHTGTAAAVAGGLSLALGAALQLLPQPAKFSDQVVTDTFAASSALRFVGAICITWGLVSIHLRQVDQVGRFGLVAIVACMANMALQTGWIFADLFITPALADQAPQILDGDTPGRMAIGFLAAWLANASFVLLGIATLRARILPKACGIGLIIAGVIALLPLPVDGAAYELVIGAAISVAGAFALREPDTTRPAAEQVV
ncbi:hypothetical protein ACWDBW_15390 [Streptomyces sp. NPDC001107]